MQTGPVICNAICVAYTGEAYGTDKGEVGPVIRLSVRPNLMIVPLPVEQSAIAGELIARRNAQDFAEVSIYGEGDSSEVTVSPMLASNVAV